MKIKQRNMNQLRSYASSLRVVKTFRAEKWRRRAASQMLPKREAIRAENDAAQRRALVSSRKKRDPAVAGWEQQLSASGSSLQTAEDMIWYRLAYGFTFHEYRCYAFSDKTPEERLAFFSDRESVLLSYRLNDLDAMSVFSDKWKTYCRFRQFYRREAVRIGSEDDFGAFCRFFGSHPVAIAKPSFGSCGNGVRKIDSSAADIALREVFAELLCGGETVLEEPIAQSEALACFHPSSVNTVRIVTFCGAEGVRLLWAFLKTGRNGSLTDNGAAGGIMAGIDIAGGIVTTDGVDEDGCRFTSHPDTGKLFAGSAVPDWENLKSLCLSAASLEPKVRMVGWDAAHTENGWVIVEGNAQSEMIGPQAVYGKGLRQEILNLLKECRLPTDEYRA